MSDAIDGNGPPPSLEGRPDPNSGDGAATTDALAAVAQSGGLVCAFAVDADAPIARSSPFASLFDPDPRRLADLAAAVAAWRSGGASAVDIGPFHDQRWYRFAFSVDAGALTVAQGVEVTDLVARDRLAAAERAQVLAGIGYFVVDAEKRRVIVSKSLARMRGVDLGPEPLPLDEAFKLFYPPGERAGALERVAHAIESGEPYERVIAIQRRGSGAPRRFRVEVRPELDETGRVAHLFGVVQDVTQVDAARRALEERDRQFERAQRLGRMGHFRYDLRTGEAVRSEHFYEILGLDPSDPAEHSPRAWERLCEPGELDRLDRAREEAIAEGREQFAITTWIRRGGDGARRELLSERSIEYEDGRPTAIFGIVQDVTERESAKRELEQQHRLFRQAEQMGRLAHFRHDFRDGESYWSDSSTTSSE